MPFRISMFFNLVWACYFSVCAQKNEDFTQELELIRQKYESVERNDQKNIVFTGSSSIRLWEDLEQAFPDHRIINTGFGGSESSDLLEYVEPLILDYRPVKVFIYEGDNDLSYHKSPGRVLRTTRKILERIWDAFPETRVVLIAAKPSPVRWHLKRRFHRLNSKFERFAERSPLVEFADVWDVMLNGRKVDDSLFAEDGLHMNKKGYALWYEVLKTYLN